MDDNLSLNIMHDNLKVVPEMRCPYVAWTAELLITLNANSISHIRLSHPVKVVPDNRRQHLWFLEDNLIWFIQSYPKNSLLHHKIITHWLKEQTLDRNKNVFFRNKSFKSCRDNPKEPNNNHHQHDTIVSKPKTKS